MTDTKAVGRLIKVSKGGWGFISSKDIEFTRIFFHWTALLQDTLNFKELEMGMWVEFTPVKIDGKGYRAIQIRVIEKPKRIEDAKVSVLYESGPENDGASNDQTTLLPGMLEDIRGE